MVEYSYSRLCFKADIIEPLNDNDEFIIHTPDGDFKMTKREFYENFPKVVSSYSYQVRRLYHTQKPSQKANNFLMVSNQTAINQTITKQDTQDLVGDDIREKIREIGKIWRMSKHNPHIESSVLQHWENVIEKWAEDDSMPLIVRKDTKNKGRSFSHPCGREIIVSDNTFAIWVYYNVINNITYTLSQLKEMLFKNEIPMVFIATKEVLKYGKYTKALGAHSLSNWKVCHIEPIGFNDKRHITELSIASIKEHFIKYANPYNIFILPKEIGDLGEIEVFIDEQRRI